MNPNKRDKEGGSGALASLDRVHTEDDLLRLLPGVIVNVALHLIVENKYNARSFYRTAEVDELALSMSKNGQLVAVSGWVQDGKIRIQDGQKRWRGARAANMPYLRVELKEVPNPLDSYLISREMNQTRSDQTVLDDAVRWKDLLAEGIFANQEAIADSVGISGGTVSKILSINHIPEKFLIRMKEHKSTSGLRVAYELVLMFKNESVQNDSVDIDVLFDEVFEKIIKKEMTVNQVRDLVQSKFAQKKTRVSSTARDLVFGKSKGKMKIFESRGQVDFSVSGLSPRLISALTKAIEAVAEKASEGGNTL